MKMIKSVDELKKGDMLIVKDSELFMGPGYETVRGDVFLFDNDNSSLLIKCKETNGSGRRYQGGSTRSI